MDVSVECMSSSAHLTDSAPDQSPSTALADAEKLHWQLFRMMSTMRRQEYDRTASGALTLTQCSLLYFLSDRRRATMSELAAAERVAPPTMSKAVRRLAELGMVRRVRDSSDHRTVWVEITPKGMETQREAVAGFLEMTRETLSPEEIAALHASLAALERLVIGAELVADGNHARGSSGKR